MRTSMRVAVVSIAAAAIVSGPVGPAPTATAHPAFSTSCPSPASAAIVTLDLSPKLPYPHVRVHQGDVIRVVASLKGWAVTRPKAERHAGAVCRISKHQPSRHRSVGWFRVLHNARQVTFGSTAFSPGCANCAALGLGGKAHLRGDSTFSCDRPHDPAVDRLRLSNRMPTPRARAHRGDVVRVAAPYLHNSTAFPRPSRGWQAVCRIAAWHKKDGTAVATFRTLHVRRKVIFYSGVIGCGGPQMCPALGGRLRIKP